MGCQCHVLNKRTAIAAYGGEAAFLLLERTSKRTCPRKLIAHSCFYQQSFVDFYMMRHEVRMDAERAYMWISCSEHIGHSYRFPSSHQDKDVFTRVTVSHWHPASFQVTHTPSTSKPWQYRNIYGLKKTCLAMP